MFSWLQVAQLQEQVSARDATLRNIHAARDQQQQQLLLAMGKDKQELDVQARLLWGCRLLCGACPIVQLTSGCCSFSWGRGRSCVPATMWGQGTALWAVDRPGSTCCLPSSQSGGMVLQVAAAVCPVVQLLSIPLSMLVQVAAAKRQLVKAHKQHQQEMAQLEERVRSAVAAKDDSITALRQQLEASQQQVQALEAVLQQQQAELCA